MKKIVRLIFIIFNLLLVVLLLASTAAGMVPPDKFVWFSMLSYAFLPLLIANIGLVVLWLTVGSKWFLLSTIAIALRWGIVCLYFQTGGAAEETKGNALKMMSYNMHQFNGNSYVETAPSAEQMDELAREFLGLVSEEKPDVMCLQEFLPHTRSVKVADSLSAMGYTYHISAHPSQEYSTSIIWSRFPLINGKHIDKSTKVMADVVKGHDTLSVISVHLTSYQLNATDFDELENFSQGEVNQVQLKQTARKFKQTILAHADEWEKIRPCVEQTTKPVLVAGDFNDPPASYIYQKMAHILKDSYREKGKGFGTTYSHKLGSFRIDYIFVSDKLQVRSYQRIKSPLSDHYPIVSTIEFPTR
mgnify:CR=1 FL=1